MRVLLVAITLALASAPPALAQAPSGEAAPPDTVVSLRSEGAELAFMPDRLSLKAGQRVRIRYTNDGTLPHNLVFARDEADLDPLAQAAYDAADTGFVPTDLADRMIAHTPLVSPGQTVDIDFVVPPPGEYTYICLFPGHSNMMLGTLRSLP
jgi:azurin